MTDMRDDLVERVVEELRTLPATDEGAVGRIVAAAAAADVPVDPGRSRATAALRWWRSRVPLAAAAGIALAAGLAGFVVGDVARREAVPSVAAVGDPAPESLRLASATPGALGATPAAVPTQFVLDAPRATRVALVGNFNGWDEAATPLIRDPSSGIWTTTVSLAPGRHVYAFVVDGRSLTLDPRAPTAQDPEFGTPSSVVLVGTP